MATKKTEVTEDVKLEEAAEVKAEVKAEEKPVDPWKRDIDMIVPRKPRGEEQQYYVCVNDRRFIIPANGKMQKLPEPIAKALQDSLDADAEAYEFMDSMPNHSGEDVQNHAI